MQIIIDIDEDDYKLIKDGNSIPSNLRDLVTSSLFYRIRNGKLLPKRHGRLIDADRVIKKMEEREEKLKDDKSIWETAGVETALNMFGETIIEADRSDEE